MNSSVWRLFTTGAWMNTRAVVAAASFLCGSAIGAHALPAQADVIRGRVTSTVSDLPIEGVTITVTSLTGGVSRVARTDRNGRFTIAFPGSAGDYWITVTSIGSVPRRFELKRVADEDILVADVRLSPMMSALDTVAILGRRDRPIRRDSVSDVGGTDRDVNTGNVAIEQLGNLALMAASVPGLLYVPGVAGDPAGLSAFGLDPSQNSTTINGLNSGATDLPRDGLYGVGVALSPYDVSIGQFSGARLAVSIASGTNYKRHLASGVLNTPALEWTDRVGRSLGQEYYNANVGGGISGPLALNTSFYNISYQAGRAANDLRTILNTNPVGLSTAGIAPDSVTQFLNALRELNIPATVSGFPSTRNSDQARFLAAFDVVSPTSGSGQTFKFVLNGAWTRSAPVASVATSVPAATFKSLNWNGAVQMHHVAYFGIGVLSETGVAYSRSQRLITPYLEMPSGRVRIQSELDDAGRSVRTLDFGGAINSTNTSFNSAELLNQLSWFSLNNRHRLKLSTSLRRDAYDALQNINTRGTFTFNSLGDLDAGSAASFSRQLAPVRANSSALLASVSIGDSYRFRETLQFVFGVRLDGNAFLERPVLNPTLVDVLSLRNDGVPNRAYLSPRIGFSWTGRPSPDVASAPGMAGFPRIVVRGGAGVFQGAPSATLPLQAVRATGLSNGIQQLTCTGNATPMPDWNAFGTDPTSVPTTCADGTTGNPFANNTPNVTLFSRDYRAPRSIRSNISVATTLFANRVRSTIGALFSQNERQPGFVDRNLDTIVRFALAEEGSRPVFVNTASIAPFTGAIASRDGRRISEFSHVTEMQSNSSSVARQLQFSLAPVASSTRYTWGVNYVLNDVRDRVNGFVSASDNPFALNHARSAYDWRHQFQLSVGYNVFDLLRIQWFHSLVSGTPYSPMVAGDVNGDGQLTNDRAFIFDPAGTNDVELTSDMQRLFTSSSRKTRECLERQIGRIASRNSCEGPWTSTAAMRIDFNPIKVRMPQRTMISLSITNPLAGLDLLLHGASNTRGWGQVRSPDDQLLFVRGFDPATPRFRYQVNSRFGSTNATRSALRSPVAITMLMRVDLGPSRERQDLVRTLDRGRTTPGLKVTAAELRSAYGSAGILNPMAIMLRSADSMRLNGLQADSLAGLDRWFRTRLDSIWTPVVREYSGLPDRYSQKIAYTRYLRAREASVDLLIRIAPAINALLLPAQRRLLPPLTSSYLDRRFLLAVRSRTPGISGPVFPPPAGTAAETGSRGRGGGPF